MKSFYKLILKRRTIRRFRQKKVSRLILRKLINAARLAPSAANLQFLEYLIIDDKALVNKIFPFTKWAGYLEGRGTPLREEIPSVFIAVLKNLRRSSNIDLRDIGAAVENILLAGICFNIAGCWIASINKPAIGRILRVPQGLDLDSVVALGYTRQKSRVFDSRSTVKYSQLPDKNLIVPKRPLRDILHFNYFK